MTPRKLALSPAALADLKRRTAFFERQRGPDFALDWARRILSWLQGLAESGAVLGTSHPTRKGIRTFPFRDHATILADFTTTELRVIRIYFAGQDWLA